jgi:hypothetical protein
VTLEEMPRITPASQRRTAQETAAQTHEFVENSGDHIGKTPATAQILLQGDDSLEEDGMQASTPMLQRGTLRCRRLVTTQRKPSSIQASRLSANTQEEVMRLQTEVHSTGFKESFCARLFARMGKLYRLMNQDSGPQKTQVWWKKQTVE